LKGGDTKIRTEEITLLKRDGVKNSRSGIVAANKRAKRQAASRNARPAQLDTKEFAFGNRIFQYDPIKVGAQKTTFPIPDSLSQQIFTDGHRLSMAISAANFHAPNGTVAKLRAASHTNGDAARQLPRQTLMWQERSATDVTPSQMSRPRRFSAGPKHRRFGSFSY